MNFDAATGMILDHLRAGLLISAARRIVYYDQHGTEHQLNYRIMSRQHWQEIHEDDLARDHFWDTGTAKTYSDDVHIRRKFSIVESTSDPDMIALAIRFDPDSISRLAPPKPSRATSTKVSNAPAPITPMTGSKGMPIAEFLVRELLRDRTSPAPSTQPLKTGIVAQSEIERWFADLSPEQQAQGQRWLWDKAKTDLSKDVKRKQIEPFVSGRPRGRPRSKK
jgi:hypothetical protein